MTPRTSTQPRTALGEKAREVSQSEEKFTVELKLSRQDYMDVKHAWEYCRQNDKIKPLTLRLGKLSEAIREALDRVPQQRQLEESER